MKKKQKTKDVMSESDLTQTNVVTDETVSASSETAEIVVEETGKKSNKVINTIINGFMILVAFMGGTSGPLLALMQMIIPILPWFLIFG